MTRATKTLLILGAMLAFAAAAGAQDAAGEAAVDFIQAIQNAAAPGRISGTLLLLLALTVLSLAPAILVMMTSFTRIVVVLGFLRQAMATQQSPPNQVIIGLALFLTYFIMAPTFDRVYQEAVVPYAEQQLTLSEAVDAGLQPMRQFMFRQTAPKDLALFLNIRGLERPDTPDDVPTSVLIPAFIISEMRVAFQIGFIIYIPFLIIDMVVASTLMAMGMMMLPPVFVSLPFKIIMFVLADGWYLLFEGLVRSFG